MHPVDIKKYEIRVRALIEILTYCTWSKGFIEIHIWKAGYTVLE